MQEMVWADIFALVGWDEPFATVYVEALAAGKPIICCDDGGICDVLESGVQGLAVPPRDVDATSGALRRLLSDSQLRAEMSVAAKALFTEQLSTSAYADTIISELALAAGSGQGATAAG
jgi:glycosyltransferase involved in cell wall biosynthesis